MKKNVFAKNRMDYLLNLIEPSKKDKILNIGISNIPEIEMKLEDKVKEVWTIDLDKKKLQDAKKFLKKTKLIEGDALKTKFKKGYFDKVVILEVLEHLEKDQQMVDKISQILKKNGKLIISVPNDSFMHIINPLKYFEHKRHYSKEKIIKVIENSGFKIEHFNVVENWKLLGNLYLHILNKFLLRKKRKFNLFDKNKNETYSQKNRSGLDIVIKARK